MARGREKVRQLEQDINRKVTLDDYGDESVEYYTKIHSYRKTLQDCEDDVDGYYDASI